MSSAVRHLWLTGDCPPVLSYPADELGSALVVDADRRLRGPYTGAGTVVRALAPGLYARRPELLRAHAIELLSAAPEIDQLTGPAPDTLTSLASADERTRWYSRLRTRRIAHGLIDLLRSWSEPSTTEAELPHTLVFRNVDRADFTDQEFLTLALRRLDPARVRIVAITGRPELPEALRTALETYSEPRALPTAGPAASSAPAPAPAPASAFEELSPEQHDEQAERLARTGEWSLRLGAIPYHRERGRRATTEGVRALREAAEYCAGMGFYDACLDLAERLTPLAEQSGDPRDIAAASAYRTQCLAMLNRPAETERHYFELLAQTTAPVRQLSLHYSLAMLYTRLYGPEHKDHLRAKAYVNTAVALAEQLPDPVERAFQSVFMSNGKALVETHLGNLPAALDLVTAGIARLERELGPDQHRLHRSVLHHNRAQVLLGLGRPEQALTEFDHVIAVDPAYPEYRFDRGNLHFRLGHHQEALADYAAAIRLSPPFPEVRFNRGSVLAELGDTAGASADFRAVLDLEPDYLEARVSLAALLTDHGEAGAAAELARTGLTLTPAEPRLHCALGLVMLELGDLSGALDAFDRSLELDPDSTEALVNRAVTAHGLGRLDDALTDLTRAIERSPDDPDLRFNRGFVLETAERWTEAIEDYTVALAHAEDQDELLARRGHCESRLSPAH